MKQLQFLLSAILLIWGVAVAQAEIVITADETTTVKVAEVKSMTFDGDFNTGYLLLNLTDGTTSKLPISSIKSITFSTDTDASAIKSVATTKGSTPTVAVQGDMLFITSQGGRASIFSTTGKLVSATALSEGTTTLSLNQLPNGIYMVDVNGNTVKIQKK